MAKTNWARIEKLNGGPIFYTDPPLDEKDEVWFYAKSDKSARGYELRVYSRGSLRSASERPDEPRGPITGRATLYDLLATTVVDVELYGETGLLRRGLLNGALVTSALPASELESTLARYRALGFRDGTPWNATPRQVTRRNYLKGSKTSWSAWIDGNSLVELGAKREEVFPSREAAMAALEERVASKRKAGFRLYGIELQGATHANPAPKRPGAQKRPRAATTPKPTSPFEAVDAAIAIVTELHTRWPKGHAVLERADAKAERARLDALGLGSSFSRRLHAARFNRWAKSRGGPKNGESSFQYFARRYGSLTWVVDTALEIDLPGFHVGNVSGGGWSHLEIDADGTYEMDGLIEATGQAELEALLVFHGGWHDGHAFALDRRAKSKSGEHPIVSFDESAPELARSPTRLTIQPFGDWLYARVKKVARAIEPALALVN